jgi:hypothetical protein
MKKGSPMKNTRVIGAALTAAAMFLPSSRPALADAAPEKGIVAFKYLNYKDSQPGEDLMIINAYSLRAMTPIAGKWAIDVTGTIDSVAGASPKYHAISQASTIKADTRHATDLSVTRYLPFGSTILGGSFSQERDYISRSVSLQQNISTPSKNTTINLGYSYAWDYISTNSNPPNIGTKHTNSWIVGVTQVMSKNDIVQLNLGYSLGKGIYTQGDLDHLNQGIFSDAYKMFDLRPDRRRSSTIMTKWNHYFEATGGASHFSYRYYGDSWGIKSHTFTTEYVQPLPADFTVTPSARYYSQTAASFYVPTSVDESLDNTNFPDLTGLTYYSCDQRLSAFGAVTLGIKVEKRIAHDWIVDARYDHYVQQGRYGLSKNYDRYLPRFNANFIQLGIAKEF